jgi:hypothetical protein
MAWHLGLCDAAEPALDTVLCRHMASVRGALYFVYSYRVCERHSLPKEHGLRAQIAWPTPGLTGDAANRWPLRLLVFDDFHI